MMSSLFQRAENAHQHGLAIGASSAPVAVAVLADWRRPLINRGYNELVDSTNPRLPGKRLVPILMGLKAAEEGPQDPVF